MNLEPPALASPTRRITVALLGNPNTGKTTLFNALAGMRQRVGNYPGVTVETKRGHMTFRGQAFDLVDLPGTYSLAARSPDEMVAVDVILGQQPGESRPDVVLAIVDASNLERNLYLTTQALELGVPVVLALNMIDVAEAQGTRIDVARLEKQLGIPTVAIQANKGRGLEALKARLAEAVRQEPVPGVVFPEAFRSEVEALRREIGADVPVFLVERLLLDVGGYTEKSLGQRLGNVGQRIDAARRRLASAGCAVPAVEARARYAWIRQALAGCIERPARRPITWTDRLDRVLTHRFWGTVIFLALMFVVFVSIFTWAAPLMDVIKDGKKWLAGSLRATLPRGPVNSLVVNGIVEGVGSVLVFLPQIAILFGFIAILEDCGYMARAAFLMDKLMARCGLSGKSFIPMLSSVACAVPGIMATRVIENRRDRLATILVAPLMSCSARLPVYTLLIGAFLTEGYGWWVPGVTLFAMYLIGLIVAPLVALVLKSTLLRGETPVFIMEMPLYKFPSPRQVLHRMFDRSWAFVRRAGTLILASMIVVWALLYFPRGSDAGPGYDEQVAQLEDAIKDQRADEAQIADKQEELNQLYGTWKRNSWLGRMGRGIEPAIRPLGWDWKIGMAALASFPAREVVVGTLGIIYNLGEGETEELKDPLTDKLKDATDDADPGRKVYSVPVALSLMVFFALCCQCASTLAVIRRETNSWRWPAFTFVYMTVLAYLGALVVYQVGRWFV